MSDHRQHGLMMARPPRRSATTQPEDSGDAAPPASRSPAEAAIAEAAQRVEAQRVVGLFGRFFHRRSKPG